MANLISLCRCVALTAMLALGACATHGELSEVRQSLSWGGELITWTVENPSAHSIVIDDYTETDMGVPGGVWIRVTDATGRRLAYDDHGDGWHSPWFEWSSAWTRQPLELAPSMRIQHTFTAADLSVGIRVSEPIATEGCRYQVRVAVLDPDLNARKSETSEWNDIECSVLHIPYCPRVRVRGGFIRNCGGGPLPEGLRDEVSGPER